MDQSSNDFNPNNNIETSSNFPQFSFVVFSQAYIENGQRNEVEEEHTSNAMQVDDGSITRGYHHSNSMKEAETIERYLNDIKYDPFNFLNKPDLFDLSNSFIQSKCLLNFDQNTPNVINDASQKGVQEVSSNHHQIDGQSKAFNNGNSNSESLAMPSPSTPEGLRRPTKCKTDALFNKARKLNKKLVVFKMKNYSKLTIENGQEFHECKKKRFEN